MNWVLYFQVFLSGLVAFLTVGGSWVIFTTDQLKEYQLREKIVRTFIGFSMFGSGIGLCLLYNAYIKQWLI